MPINGTLANRVMLGAPAGNVVAGAMLINGGTRHLSPICTYTGAGNHAERTLMGYLTADVATVRALWAVAQVPEVQVYCTKSPCNGCVGYLNQFKAGRGAQIGTYNFYWSYHWIPDDIQGPLNTASASVAAQTALRAAANQRIAALQAESAMHTTNRPFQVNGLNRVNLSPAGAATLTASIARIDARLVAIPGEIAAEQAAAQAAGTALNTANAQFLAAAQAVTAHIAAQVQNLAALTAAGWTVEQI